MVVTNIDKGDEKYRVEVDEDVVSKICNAFSKEPIAFFLPGEDGIDDSFTMDKLHEKLPNGGSCKVRFGGRFIVCTKHSIALIKAQGDLPQRLCFNTVQMRKRRKPAVCAVYLTLKSAKRIASSFAQYPSYCQIVLNHASFIYCTFIGVSSLAVLVLRIVCPKQALPFLP